MGDAVMIIMMNMLFLSAFSCPLFRNSLLEKWKGKVDGTRL